MRRILRYFYQYTAGQLTGFIRWALDLVRQTSTHTCAATARTCWGYVGDPSAANPPRLITGIGANVPCITGGRWVSADSKFYTTETDGTTLNPFTTKSTPDGNIKVFTAYPDHAVSTAYALDEQVAILTSAGNRCYLTCTKAGTTAATAPTVTDANVAAQATVADGANVDWQATGYATGLAYQLEAAATNSVPDSREFDAASWVVTGTPVRTANAVGVDGGANLAYTLEDDDAGSIELITDTMTVTSAANPCVATVFIKKDNDETRFPAIQISLTGGVATTGVTWLNTKTGAIVHTDSGTSFVEDFGEWWRVGITVTKDAGNNSVGIKIYPAVGTVIGTGNVAATGSIIVDQADFRDNQSFMDSAIITSGGTATRAATLLTDTTAGRLTTAGIAGRITCVIDGAGQTNNILFASSVDANNRIFLVTAAANTFFYKVVGGSFTEVASSTFTYTAGVPFTFEFSHDTTDSTRGRGYDVGDTPGAWFTDTGANLDPAVIGSTFEIASDTIGGSDRVNIEVISCELSDNKADFGWI